MKVGGFIGVVFACPHIHWQFLKHSFFCAFWPVVRNKLHFWSLKTDLLENSVCILDFSIKLCFRFFHVDKENSFWLVKSDEVSPLYDGRCGQTSAGVSAATWTLYMLTHPYSYSPTMLMSRGVLIGQSNDICQSQHPYWRFTGTDKFFFQTSDWLTQLFGQGLFDMLMAQAGFLRCHVEKGIFENSVCVDGTFFKPPF